MKNILLLMLVVSLSACTGGSGGYDDIRAYAPDTIVTPGLLNNPELAQKLKTIEYVENNLGPLMESEAPSTASTSRITRSATTSKLNNGSLTMTDFNARYQKALEYFDVLKKVINNTANPANITNKEIKIAYSLSADKPYEALTQYDLPDIDFTESEDETTLNIAAALLNIQISIRDKVESNIVLKDSITEEIAGDTQALADLVNNDVEIDPNASLINSNLLDNLVASGTTVEQGLENMFREFEFHFDDRGVIDGVTVEDSFVLDRVDKTSVFNNIAHPLWYFNFRFVDAGGEWHNDSIEDLENRITDRDELATMVGNFLRREYDENAMPNSRIDEIVSRVTNDANYGEWEEIVVSGDMHSLGKMNGLRYSDFGYYTVGDYNFTFTYDGGMADKKISRPEMIDVGVAENTKMVFHGTAAGELQQNLEVDGVNVVALEDNNRPITTNNGAATLTFFVKDGKETINMPFNNWYDVTVTKSGDYVTSINFDGDENVEQQWKMSKTFVDYVNGESYYRNPEHGEENGLPEISAVYGNQNDNTYVSTTMTTTYYGDNPASHNPIEATSYVNHVDEHEFDGEYTDEHEHRYTGSIEREIWFSSVFGGTKR